MSDLHPTARALIEAAKRGENPLPAGARSRVRTTVLRRAAAFGLTLTSTTVVSVAAKGGALATALASPLLSAGAIGAAGTVAFFVARAALVSPAPPLTMAPSIVASVAVRSGGAASPRSGLPLPPAPALVPESPAPSSFAPVSAPSVLLTPERAGAPLSVRVVGSQPSLPVLARAPDPAPNLSADAVPPRSAEPLFVDPAAPSIAAPPAGHPDSDLAAAIDVLHRARGALRAGQPEQAIDLLRRNAALLDAGPFAEEAQAARASALCQLGRTQEAQAAIDRFLRVWPASPLATRLRDGCGALGGIGATPAK